MKQVVRFLCILLPFCLFSAILFSHVKKPEVRNVILFIGDGMGIASITSTRIWSQGSWGKLNMEKFPVVGLMKTYSGSDYVTDSAASATALASGVKTYNGAIGVSYETIDPKKKSRNFETILDVAKKIGKSVGIITSTRVSHATSAAFYAHVKERDMEKAIVEYISEADLDLVLGGGRCYFFPEKWIDPQEKLPGLRDDKRNLIQEMKSKGWTYVTTRSELEEIKTSTKIIGLFRYSHLSFDHERVKNNKDEPSLKELVEFGIKKLSVNPKGYVLIVEGGKIDHASHHNDAYGMVSETLAFDQAIGAAVRLVNEQDTLLVITADHETGGLSLNGYRDLEITKGKKFINQQCVITSDPLVTWASGPKHKDNQADICMDTPATFYRQSAAHTAVDVPIISKGPGSQRFTGFIDNEDVAWLILRTLGTKFSNPVNHENYRLFRK